MATNFKLDNYVFQYALVSPLSKLSVPTLRSLECYNLRQSTLVHVFMLNLDNKNVDT